MYYQAIFYEVILVQFKGLLFLILRKWSEVTRRVGVIRQTNINVLISEFILLAIQQEDTRKQETGMCRLKCMCLRMSHM